MAGSINTVAVSGNLTRDPELRYTPGGTAVVNLGLANTRNRKDGEEWVEETSFFDITVWGKHGEMCVRKLNKGSQVFIVGRLEQQRWETEANEKRSKVQIVATRVEGPDFFKSKDEDNDLTGGGATVEPQGQVAEKAAATQDDDIPF